MFKENATIVTMAKIPDCSFCDPTKPAKYDGKTTMGPWAYLCEFHYNVFGIGLGMGRGQKLELE